MSGHSGEKDAPKCEGLAPFCCGNPSCPAHGAPTPTCADCGAPLVVVQRGQCSRCGSDRGPADGGSDA